MSPIFPLFSQSHTCNKMFKLFVILSVFFAYVECSIARPRGVAISKASFYNPDKPFTCLDGSTTIPFEYVNDDYCDCSDGSDEPGTSACSNGFFHCTNAGHKPLNIPSSRVNDGICDCCDGTDEYSGIITCANTCRELGRQAREEAAKLKIVMSQGYAVRQEYSQQGKEARTKHQARLQEISTEKEEAENKKNELESIKKDAEDPEKEAKEAHKKAWEEEKERKKKLKDKKNALEAFKNLDTDGDLRVSTNELLVHTELDKNNDQDFTESEAKEYLEDNDIVDYATFEEKVWPNIKQIYRKEPKPTTPAPPSEGDSTPPPPGAEGETVPEEQTKGEEAQIETPPEEEEKMPEYTEETKKLIEVADKARADFNEAETNLRNIENEIRDLNKHLDADLGPDDEFYPLRENCYEYTDREYTYKLCPFEKTTQRSKSGGSETTLGNWGEWTGPEGNKYSVMKYTGGQGCWNGPDRSCTVRLVCGTTNELQAASEPNRCEYEFTFQTPAVCKEVKVEDSKDPGHDEL